MVEIEIVCVNCGKQVISKSKKRKFCSDKCRSQFRHEKDKVYTKKCVVCNKEFSASYKSAKYCGHECKGKAYKKQFGYTLDDIKAVLIRNNQQTTLQELINELGCSRNTFYKIMHEHDLNIEKLHTLCNIEYTYEDNFYFTSRSAEKIFEMLDRHFGIKGIREAVFAELVNPKTSRLLRIDWYSEELNVAVEYNGKQHYVEQKFFNNPLDVIQEKDRLKKEFCDKKGIKLVVVKWDERLSDKEIIDRLLI